MKRPLFAFLLFPEVINSKFEIISHFTFGSRSERSFLPKQNEGSTGTKAQCVQVGRRESVGLGETNCEEMQTLQEDQPFLQLPQDLSASQPMGKKSRRCREIVAARLVE